MEGQERLLVVEDDKNLGFLLSTQLKAVGFHVDLATDGEQGLEFFRSSKYDLCILDVMLPKIDGLLLAQEIRKTDETVPFIFLTARILKSDKLLGYELGCDDYITKPFDIDELILKINVIIKRSAHRVPVSTDELSAGTIRLNTTARTVTTATDSFMVSQKECLILKIFFQNMNEVVPRKDIMLEVWGNDDFFTSKSLDVYLTKVRKILKADPNLKLVNIHGFGYQLTEG